MIEFILRKRIILLCFFLIGMGKFLYCNDLPSIKIKFTSVAPKINGDINEDIWESAPFVENFYLFTGEKIASEQTKAYILYDKENLYVAFICYDSQIKELKSEKDIFKGDSIELFIGPGRTLEYTHIAVNPEGNIYFAWQQGNRKNSVKVATKILQDRWQVEMSIPFKDIKFPKLQDIKSNWVINFCRGNPKIKEYSCWSPTLIGFHNPFKFGILEGINIDTEKFLVNQKQEENTEKTIDIETDRTFYDVQKTLSFNIKLRQVDSLKNKFLRIEIIDKEGNTKIKNEIKPVLLTNQDKIDISSIPIGDYTLTVYLCELDKIIKTGTKKFYKIKPMEKPSEKIEIKNNILYLNDELYFPIILWFGAHWDKYKVLSVKDIEDISSKGFNAIMPCWPFYKEDLLGKEKIWGEVAGSLKERISILNDTKLTMREILDSAYKNGVKVIPNLPWIWRTEHLTEEQIEEGGKIILKYRDHPAIFCWLSNDETDGWIELNQTTYKLYKELDPYRPVYLNLINAVASNKDAADILSTDPYPIGKTSINKVSIHSDVLKQILSEKPNQSFWLVLQMFGSEWEGWPRCPTPKEERCMTFLSLNHGVKGLAYFIYHPEVTRKEGNKYLSEELWEYMKELNQQTKKMSLPYLLGKDIDISSNFKEIDVVAKEYKKMIYIIACNTTENEITPEILVKNLKLPERIKVLFEERVISVKDNIIKDTFSGYDVHIYQF